MHIFGDNFTQQRSFDSDQYCSVLKNGSSLRSARVCTREPMLGKHVVDCAGTCGDVDGLGLGIPKRRLDIFISLEPPVHHVPFVGFGCEYKQVRPVLWQPRKVKFHHIGDFIGVAFLGPNPPLGDD